MDTFKTTAIYPNRLEDKLEVEERMGLPEKGNDEIELFIPEGPLLLKGYTRIVYGDHGPYIEFERKHFVFEPGLKSKFNNCVDTQNLSNLPKEDSKYCSKYYYFWLYPRGHVNIKIYLQLRPVSNLPNAPKRSDGKPSAFNRAEGYADYKRGYFYVNPYFLELRDKC